MDVMRAVLVWLSVVVAAPCALAQPAATQPAGGAAAQQGEAGAPGAEGEGGEGGPVAAVTGRVTLAAGRDLVARDGAGPGADGVAGDAAAGGGVPGVGVPGGAKYVLSLVLDVSWSGAVRCLVPPESWAVEQFELDPPVAEQEGVRPKVSSTFEVAGREFLWQRYAALHRRLMKFAEPGVCDPADRAGATVTVLGLTRRPRVIGALMLRGEGWFAEPAEAEDVPVAVGGGEAVVDGRWRVSVRPAAAGDAVVETRDGAEASAEGMEGGVEVWVRRVEPRPEGPFPNPEALRDVPVGVTLLDADGGVLAELPLGWVSPEAKVYDPAVETYLVQGPLSGGAGGAGEGKVAAARVWIVPAVLRREVRVGLEDVEVP